MDKNAVKDFFDSLADSWDENQVRNESVISLILDKGAVKKNAVVLDVACGTGVLFGDYLSRGVASLSGIDISQRMLEIAAKKFPDVKLICADAESYNFSQKYDVIMIYNAFPHFADREKLIANLTSCLKVGGRLSIAHGISMSELEKCHSGQAERVSLPLPDKEEMTKLLAAYLDVDIGISDDAMYMVSGVRREC